MRRSTLLTACVLPLLCVAILCQPAPARAERRTALVIGNSAYAGAPLKNPANDARDMAAALRRLGFETTLLTDASMQQMEQAVRDFGLKLRQGGMGLFYYAGHGLQVQGNNYLVPVNAVIQSESDVKYGCLDAGLVLGKMEDAGNGLNIVILDACRNNPFARSFRSAEQGLAKMDAPTGSLIAYATAPGKVASDGEGKNGLYTQYLLRNIATPGLSVEELFKRVRMGVARDSAKKQVPWEASSLIGQFSFVAGAQVASLAPAAPPAAIAPAPLPPVQSPAAPPGADVSFDDIRRQAEAQQRAEEDARRQWSQWQAGMRKAAAEADKLSKDGRLKAEAKATAWRRVAEAYAADNPYAGQADAVLRKHVQAQLQYWESRGRQELALAPAPKQAPAAGAAQRPGATWRDPATGMEFVWVPGGCYLMGKATGGPTYVEGSQQCVQGFWMARTEVTEGQWKRVMGKGAEFSKGDAYPMNYMAWDEIQEFIARLGRMGQARFRLPSDAEWEYACRSGGRDELYPGGGTADQTAWYGKNSGGAVHPVGGKAANGLGLSDMGGNVWEVTADMYPRSTKEHSRRGGAFNFSEGDVTCLYRASFPMDTKWVDTGIRLIREP